MYTNLIMNKMSVFVMFSYFNISMNVWFFIYSKRTWGRDVEKRTVVTAIYKQALVRSISQPVPVMPTRRTRNPRAGHGYLIQGDPGRH